MPMIISEYKRGKVTVGWRKIRNNKRQDFPFSLNRLKKSRPMYGCTYEKIEACDTDGRCDA